ncbi:MAG: hypothetical protein QG630_484 [Patescibacteria group bacterium]|nr:hypothetical protein [Patescibacteria group bacterium]
MDKYKILHPALDIKDNILVIGFNKRTFNQEDKKMQKENHYLVVEQSSDKSLKTHIIKENTFTSNTGQNYAFDSNSEGKQRRLINIDDRWSNELLEKLNNDIKYKNINPNNVGKFNKIENQLRAYVFLERDEDYKLVTSWIMMTYLFPIFPALPYLHFKAPKSSGKSTALTFIKLLAFNANKSNASIPAMRDIIDNTRGTFIIDQADNKLGSKADNVMKDILTDAYKASSGKVSKQVVINKDYQPVEFDAYSPKALGSHRDLHPDLSDRCIQIPMFKSPINVMYLDEDKPIWLEIRDDLYRFLVNNFSKAKETYNDLVMKYQEDKTLVGRPLELWLPLEVVMRFCNLDDACIESTKSRFIDQFSSVEYFISETEREVIEIILNKFDIDDISIVITNKEIAEQMPFSEDKEDADYMTSKNVAIYIGHIIKRLNIATKIDHQRDGKHYLVFKDRVLMIAKGYDMQIPEHLIKPITSVDVTAILDASKESF